MKKKSTWLTLIQVAQQKQLDIQRQQKILQDKIIRIQHQISQFDLARSQYIDMQHNSADLSSILNNKQFIFQLDHAILGLQNENTRLNQTSYNLSQELRYFLLQEKTYENLYKQEQEKKQALRNAQENKMLDEIQRLYSQTPPHDNDE